MSADALCRALHAIGTDLDPGPPLGQQPVPPRGDSLVLQRPELSRIVEIGMLAEQVGDDPAVFCKGQNMAVGFGKRPQKFRQPVGQLAHKRRGGDDALINGGIAGLGKSQPDLSVKTAHQVVGITGQVLKQDDGRFPRRGNVQILCGYGNFPDAIFSCFIDEKPVFIFAQHHAVGEAESFGHNPGGLCCRVVFQNASGRALFQNVDQAGRKDASPFFGRKTRGGVGEINFPRL